MPLYDMPLEELRAYTPERREPADFDAFWADTLADARSHKLAVSFDLVDTPLRTLTAFDVTFAGFAGEPIKGWLILPHKPAEVRLPCVVEFIGYGGGRGFATDWLWWASCGYAHFIMDTRGQGSTWSHGDTPDDAASCPQVPGFMTRGIDAPENYYYRRVFTDAVRAIEAARTHPMVDPDRVMVSGGSQGGGITLAVAGLVPDLLAVAPDVPFLCHFERACDIAETDPYGEIVRYCTTRRGAREQVFSTLSYFDGVNFAARAKAEALFAMGMMDKVCPPSTVYAAYNHYAGPKSITEYYYNNHEGGGAAHQLAKTEFFQRLSGDLDV